MRQWKQITAIVLIFFLLISVPRHSSAEMGVSARSAILIEQESGRVLFEKDAHTKRRIASITKIMTAIVALEIGDLKEKVKASSNAVGVEGSSIYLREGEVLTLEDLLYGLMLRSGNDAAVAIAEHIGGSVEGFAYLMNKKAAELGMEQTVFSNPHGLDTHEEHYSSAKDMAELTAYALQNEDFAQIVAAQKWTAPLEGEEWDRVWTNKNKMLQKYPYADGVKTGYTDRARRTLVSSATKDGHQLVAVTLNDGNDWDDHIRMLEYGFDQFTPVTLAEQDERIKDERIERADGYFKMLDSFVYPLKNNETVRKRMAVDQRLNKALERKKEEEIPIPAGYVYYLMDGKEIGRTPVEFVYEREEFDSFWSRFFNVVEVVMRGIHG
jgi:serine-type D-Ala-D-Ala carboxypeptidase (penicillin-binding protein 5/6)